MVTSKDKIMENIETTLDSIYEESTIERDMDLLLLEEFHCSSEFRQTFFNAVATQGADLNTAEYPHLLSARHSVHDIYGEADLVVIFDNKQGKKWTLLIEDKINADFQPDQAERYLLRGKNLYNNQFTTVLVAPQKYFGDPPSNHSFHARVSFEKIKEWLNTTTPGSRGEYKAALIDSAIKRATAITENPVITAFFRSYWFMSKERLPELNLKNPGKLVSTWLNVPLPGNPSDTVMIIKLEGRVDLHFSNMSKNLSQLKTRFGPYLTTDMGVVAAGGSGTIRIIVPPLNPYQPFEEQTEHAFQSMVAALRLLRVYQLGVKN